MKTGIITFLLSLWAVASACGAEVPRYIFYFIGDGMGMGQVQAAQV